MRDRVVELLRVPAESLEPHPANWRRHPAKQRAVLAALLREIGLADALLARRDAEGRLHLIDGHLRAELAGGEAVPVLVLDVTESEAEQLLATLDPLAALAETDAAALTALAARLTFEDPQVAEMLAALTRAEPPPSEPVIPEAWQVLVECDGEADQRRLYEQLTAEGWRCRVITL